jgi:hypothetical protein
MNLKTWIRALLLFYQMAIQYIQGAYGQVIQAHSHQDRLLCHLQCMGIML